MKLSVTCTYPHQYLPLNHLSLCLPLLALLISDGRTLRNITQILAAVAQMYIGKFVGINHSIIAVLLPWYHLLLYCYAILWYLLLFIQSIINDQVILTLNASVLVLIYVTMFISPCSLTITYFARVLHSVHLLTSARVSFTFVDEHIVIL